ncbi:hypothetical protein KAW65_07925 [candidate division WOR-3 bacterium]|nr:hypothetical protein [candidate division WOR-3 bacterium]
MKDKDKTKEQLIEIDINDTSIWYVGGGIPREKADDISVKSKITENIKR